MGTLRVINCILTVAVAFVCGCKEEGSGAYSNKSIVLDNAQAALYFHAVFREAEYAWALADDRNYVAGTQQSEDNQRTYTYSESEGMVTVVVAYTLYSDKHLVMDGTMEVEFDTCSYRKDRAIADVYLTGLSINGQVISGGSSIRYSAVADSPNDHYVFTVPSGAAIHEQGNTMPVLISVAIADGQYERMAGNETQLAQYDDVWRYVGSSTGMIRNDPNLKYTSTVIESYTVNGEARDGRIYYEPECPMPSNGVLGVIIPTGPAITYQYLCTEIGFASETQMK